MSIKVSSISEYLYCPLKLYLRYYLEDDEKKENEKEGKIDVQNDYSSHSKSFPNNQFLRNFQDLLRRNLWNVKNSMNNSQIEDILFQDVNLLIEKYMERFESTKDTKINISNFSEELAKKLRLEVQILGLRVNKIMINSQKDGPQIAEMMFPPSLQTYLMHDKSLQISGSVDKIEIIEGKYFPIKIKLGNPPLRGVWDSDALELAAYSLLIEQEFDTDVVVGFVDYAKVDDRRPVIIDSELREGLFIVLDHIREIINHGNLPEVSLNHKKCLQCNYMEICLQES
jgi:CRISPR-associated exonuclease Cas4